MYDIYEVKYKVLLNRISKLKLKDFIFFCDNINQDISDLLFEIINYVLLNFSKIESKKSVNSKVPIYEQTIFDLIIFSKINNKDPLRYLVELTRKFN